jgi:hypothetical protein
LTRPITGPAHIPNIKSGVINIDWQNVRPRFVIPDHFRFARAATAIICGKVCISSFRAVGEKQRIFF